MSRSEQLSCRREGILVSQELRREKDRWITLAKGRVGIWYWAKQWPLDMGLHCRVGRWSSGLAQLDWRLVEGSRLENVGLSSFRCQCTEHIVHNVRWPSKRGHPTSVPIVLADTARWESLSLIDVDATVMEINGESWFVAPPHLIPLFLSPLGSVSIPFLQWRQWNSDNSIECLLPLTPVSAIGTLQLISDSKFQTTASFGTLLNRFLLQKMMSFLLISSVVFLGPDSGRRFTPFSNPPCPPPLNGLMLKWFLVLFSLMFTSPIIVDDNLCVFLEFSRIFLTFVFYGKKMCQG